MDASCSRCLYLKNIGRMVVCTSSDPNSKRLFELVGSEAATRCSHFTSTSEVMEGNGAEISLDRALPFLLAGKSKFTLLSGKTGQHFSYTLTKKPKKGSESEYIYFLTFYNENRESIYAGVVFFENGQFNFRKGAKGNANPSDRAIIALIFVLNQLTYGKRPNVRVFHVGNCGRCGKRLTTPESILTGLGPECSKKCGIPRVKVD